MDELLQPPPARRAYNSPARQRQAEDTRRRILSAARELFQSTGYASTTVDMIASAAEVSPKTVSAVFGSKRGILTALVDLSSFGQRFQALRSQLQAEAQKADPGQNMVLIAQLTCQAFQHSVSEFELLRGASTVVPELADLAREVGARRRQNQSQLTEHLHQLGLLRAELTLADARDILWALTSYDVYRAFVIDCGWHCERYEAWLAKALAEQLLKL